MTPIDLGRGMIFPNRYDRDQDDGPDPCDLCEGTGEGEPVTCAMTGQEATLPCERCDGTGQVG